MGEQFISDDYTNISAYKFSELFDLKEIQELQDSFSAATGVASILTEPDGTPITEPSGYGSLCHEIRETEQGFKDCLIADLISGSLKEADPRIQQCLSGSLLDGEARIIVAGKHIASWLIWQVLDEAVTEVKEIDVDKNALSKVKRMSKLQFEIVCKYLFLNAQLLAKYARQNISFIQQINEKVINEVQIKNLNSDLEAKIKRRTAQLEETNAELEELNTILEEEMAKREKVEEEIKGLNEELEIKVTERTNQLQDMNTILEEEIIEKIRTEYELNNERVFTDALFNSAPGMIYLYDDQSKLVRWNKKHEEMTGYSSEELASMSLLDWYAGDEKSQTAIMEGIERVIKNGFGDAEASLQKKDGTNIPMYFTASPITIEGKQYFAGIGIDITERKRMHERLEKYQVLAERANDAMLFIDKKGNILEANDAAIRIYGYTYQEFSSMNIFDLRRLNKSADIIEQMELADKEGIIFETVHFLKDGTSINVEVSSKGTILGNRTVLLSIVRDITKRKQKEDENRYLSYHDVLTGLYNRRFYEEEINRLDTERNLPISIVIGDVNGLKLVNDAFGHDKGDELLQKAASAIQKACRTDDIVARWGGDEFVILLPKTNKEEAERIVNRIKEFYSNELVSAIRVSISFGWETKRKPEDEILNILKNAEDAMYKHKIIENEGMRSNTINTIINTLHEKNPREELHSKRVSRICRDIGKAIGLSEIEVNRLKVVGLLHDIGKIAIEEGILNKPGKLTESEWEQIKRHPDIGYRILSSSHEMVDLADCILAHHERWDGTGYPNGLKGEAIPMVSRIIALADSYDAMISERPYREALSEEQALKEIQKNSGTQFDPELAKIFTLTYSKER
ncbi:MAG: PAS domain S-box protein [Desulfosporosinus sp.]|nr:PAS domain S-box protein [Desulfosporosinus sp.]